MNEMEKLRRLGFDLNGGKLLPTVGETSAIAMDAALQTAANVQLPALFATWYSPEVVEILQAPLLATQIFTEEKRGEWKDLQTMFPAVEYVGQTTAYSDFGRGLVADANIENVVRDTYRFQTFIQCGDLEQETTAAQKINLLSEKQKAAARTLHIDQNNFDFYGVEGLSIYGLLNEPALPAAITASSVSTGASTTSTAWEDKSATQIYNDVLTLFNQLSAASAGLINFQSKMKLLVPPDIYGYLAKVTDLGVAPTLQVLKGYFPNLEIMSVPQMKDEDGVCTAMLIATEIDGQPTGKFGFMEKLKTFRVVLEHSSMSQKWASSTTGFLLFRPFAISRMTGIQKADGD